MQVPIRIFCLALGILCGFHSGLSAREPMNCVLLYFTSTTCSACQEMSLAVRKASDQGWLVREVDADRERSLVFRWKVTALPTIVILESGTEIDRVVGKLDPPALLSRLHSSATIRGSRTSVSPASTTIKQNADPMDVSVRIRIEDHNSVSFGTGTIVDQHGAEALVITCGHLFRDVTPASRITVDLPSTSGMQTFPATVIDYQCQETDIGLVSFPVSKPVAVAKLLPMGCALQPNEAVCSIGCDHGADPSRRDSHITKLNRYVGPANVEVAKAPVQGRSGGGLFNSKGELIGVCYAADPSLDEGLYSGPEVVYAQLQRLGLGRLYDQSRVDQPSVAMNTSNNPLKERSQEFPDRSLGDHWKSAIDQAALATRQATRDLSMQPEAFQGANFLTATLHDAHGNSKEIRIPNPNPALIQLLQNQMNSSQNNTAFASRP